MTIIREAAKQPLQFKVSADSLAPGDVLDTESAVTSVSHRGDYVTVNLWSPWDGFDRLTYRGDHQVTVLREQG